jgi:hypothetical protein
MQSEFILQGQLREVKAKQNFQANEKIAQMEAEIKRLNEQISRRDTPAEHIAQMEAEIKQQREEIARLERNLETGRRAASENPSTNPALQLTVENEELRQALLNKDGTLQKIEARLRQKELELDQTKRDFQSRLEIAGKSQEPNMEYTESIANGSHLIENLNAENKCLPIPTSLFDPMSAHCLSLGALRFCSLILVESLLLCLYLWCRLLKEQLASSQQDLHEVFCCLALILFVL